MTWRAWMSPADVPLEEHPCLGGVVFDTIGWLSWVIAWLLVEFIWDSVPCNSNLGRPWRSIAAFLFCGGAQQCVCLFIPPEFLFIASMIDIWTQAIVDFIPSDISVSFFFLFHFVLYIIFTYQITDSGSHFWLLTSSWVVCSCVPAFSDLSWWNWF